MIDLNEMVILMFVYCLYKFISEYVDYYQVVFYKLDIQFELSNFFIEKSGNLLVVVLVYFFFIGVFIYFNMCWDCQYYVQFVVCDLMMGLFN